MEFIADLHVHSRFARSTSSALTLPNMAVGAREKGITVVGTGDFTHPFWFQEIMDQLVPAESGLFRLRPELEEETGRRLAPSCRGPIRFVLQAEISTIYKWAGKTRKVHSVILAPTVASAAAINARLGEIGNLRSDGRPILGLDTRDLLEIVLETKSDAALIPAHIWTPWFSVLGASSGFNTIAECFRDLEPYVFAVESGLSSDPPMNWRLSSLDRYAIVSNSDAHSCAKLGREANIFTCELSYPAMLAALRGGSGFDGTIEFFPEEGKYHLDGHRKCHARLLPHETRELGFCCPKCHEKVTVGVLHRADELADRVEGYRPPDRPGFVSLIPLAEIAAEALQSTPDSVKVLRLLSDMRGRTGPDFVILRETPLEEISKAAGALVAEAIRRVRAGETHIAPGYDGEFGTIKLFEKHERGMFQGSLFPLAAPEPAPFPQSLPADAHDCPRESAMAHRSASPIPNCRPVDQDTSAIKQLLTRLPPAVAAVLEGLNQEQRAAVLIPRGPLLITAGPGTGKTRALACRIAIQLLTGSAQPGKVLAVTFTAKAADELRERLSTLLPQELCGGVNTRTFHAFGLSVIHQYQAQLRLPHAAAPLDEQARLAFFARALADHGITLSARQIAKLAAEISLHVNLHHSAVAPFDRDVRQAWQIFREAKQRVGVIDFDDLLSLPVELCERDGDVLQRLRTMCASLFIDEYQDVNPIQARLVELLADDGSGLTVIGDPHQAIYGFRGASPEFIKKFPHQFPGAQTVALTQNYRSAAPIIHAGLHVISATGNGEDMTLLPREPGGPLITVHTAPTDKAEAEFTVVTLERVLGGISHFSMDSGRSDGTAVDRPLDLDEIAILYRTHALAPPLEEALNRSGIPWQRLGGAHWRDSEPARIILAYLRILHRPDNPADLLEILNVPARGLGSASRDALIETANRRGISVAEAAAAPGLTPSLTTAQRQNLFNFMAELRDLREMTARGSIADTIDRLAGTRWRSPPADLAEAQNRLRTLALPFGSDLCGFLSMLALRQESDDLERRAHRVSLMTLHAAKGLEFNVVFIVGCEDGLLPFHAMNPSTAPCDVDEERRLFFVGITRAKYLLVLTRAIRRSLYGAKLSLAPSPFLGDIGKSLLETAVWTGAKRRAKAPETSAQLRLL